MKTRLLVAFIASTALGASALAQSTGTSTDTGTSTGSGSATTTTTTGTGSGSGGAAGTGTTSSPASSTGANTGSGSTGGTGGSATSTTPDLTSTPGNQSPNPNVYGNSAGGPSPGTTQHGPWSQGGWSGGFGGQPMLQGTMTCVSPAPMGGFGSFACYPMGWGMGMDGMGMTGRGWHHMQRGQWGHGPDGDYTPNDYYQDRQNSQRKSNRSRVPDYDSGDDGSNYDNDWRGNSGGYDDNSGADDYSDQ